MKFITSLCLILSVSLFAKTGSETNDKENQKMLLSVIPVPVMTEVFSGSFELTKNSVLKYDSETATKAVNELKRRIQISEDQNKEVNISFIFDSKFTRNGEYELSVKTNKINIKAGTESGFFYGVQTLLQLLPPEVFSEKFELKEKILVPSVKIYDYPRFEYRGMHLDVARHFMPLEKVKKYIDYLAMHKMNKFHWHLTEDQGWRIEIKKYPKLKEISAFRKGTKIGHQRDEPKEYDNIKHGGFYTQEEVKEVIKYADERCITVIPEIELPGHSVAAIAAYPHLSCTGEKLEVEQNWGIFDDVYCAGKESTFEFLKDLLTEVAELFPSEYIHIGGDECPKTRWKVCPKCQERIQTENLKDEHELQSYFIKRIEKFLLTKNKKIIGWDEILEGGLAPEATVMSWRGTKGGIEAAEQNHNVIMTPTSHCYFDYYQSKSENEPLAIGGFLSLEKVYSYEPVPEELPKEKQKYILGAQANVWTEYMKDFNQVEYMVFPRIDAMSEVVWSKPENKNFDDFLKRLKTQFKRYDFMKINYSKSHLKADQ